MTNREKIITYSIPMLFIIGLIAFFTCVPLELRNLTNLIGYMSSLSTIIMVIIYLFTTSQQLGAMNRQLNEMQYSRKVQYQPLLSLENYESKLDLPRYYTGPSTQFKEMKLTTRLFFDCDVSNIGNGPGISIIFFPKIVSKTKKILVESHGERVECISLKEGATEKVSFLFLDDAHKIIDALLNDFFVFMPTSILYKNSLGMPFEQKIDFVLTLSESDHVELIKSGMKIVKTSDLDYRERVNKYKDLQEENKEDEARELLREVNKEIESILSTTESQLDINVVSGSFKINALTESEYDRAIATYEETVKRILERF